MYTFQFNSTFETKQEFEKEVANLLWKIRHTWPVILENELKWVKSRTDESWLKLNNGERSQTLTKE